MRVLLLANPKAGVGRGLDLASKLAAQFRAANLSVNVLQVGEQSQGLLESGVLRTASALVVLGGDGTLHHALDISVASKTPIYHFPMGNENLFAREFGMTRDAGAVIDAIKAQNITHVDTGLANGRRFALMAGVGLDASVVHRVARVRKKAIGHRSYILPGINEVLRPCLPRLSIWVDGEQRVEATQGLAIIGNSRHYGVDLDPCRHARIDDGLLDLCFYPSSSVLSMAAWLVDSRRGVHVRRRRLTYATGSRIRVESAEGDAPVQLDGEAPGIGPDRDEGLPESRTPIEVTVEPGALPVLLPASSQPRASAYGEPANALAAR